MSLLCYVLQHLFVCVVVCVAAGAEGFNHQGPVFLLGSLSGCHPIDDNGKFRAAEVPEDTVLHLLRHVDPHCLGVDLKVLMHTVQQVQSTVHACSVVSVYHVPAQV